MDQLVATLRDQIIGQYLKENNSANGIHVLFRLRDRTWAIPGQGTRQPFEALLTYLQTKAERIRIEHNSVPQSSKVESLSIVDIKCF